ncbi:MAG: outer membrane beta-barrel protein [Candidatus Eisenbacteria bacterium]
MKHTTVLVLALSVVFASCTLGGNLRGVGPRVGLAISNWRGADADKMADLLEYGFGAEGFTCDFEKASRYGFSIGGFVCYDVTPIFAIQSEFHYVLKGIKYNGNCYYMGYPVSIDITLKTNYLEFPVLGVVTLGQPKRTNLSLMGGPYLGV